MVANPARAQLNRENEFLPVSVGDNLVSRDRFGRSVPRQPAQDRLSSAFSHEGKPAPKELL